MTTLVTDSAVSDLVEAEGVRIFSGPRGTRQSGSGFFNRLSAACVATPPVPVVDQDEVRKAQARLDDAVAEITAAKTKTGLSMTERRKLLAEKEQAAALLDAAKEGRIASSGMSEEDLWRSLEGVGEFSYGTSEEGVLKFRGATASCYLLACSMNSTGALTDRMSRADWEFMVVNPGMSADQRKRMARLLDTAEEEVLAAGFGALFALD